MGCRLRKPMQGTDARSMRNFDTYSSEFLVLPAAHSCACEVWELGISQSMSNDKEVTNVWLKIDISVCVPTDFQIAEGASDRVTQRESFRQQGPN